MNIHVQKCEKRLGPLGAVPSWAGSTIRVHHLISLPDPNNRSTWITWSTTHGKEGLISSQLGTYMYSQPRQPYCMCNTHDGSCTYGVASFPGPIRKISDGAWERGYLWGGTSDSWSRGTDYSAVDSPLLRGDCPQRDRTTCAAYFPLATVR